MVDPGPALARGRVAAQALMVDACTITRVTGETTDGDTGVVTPTTVTVYIGQCRVQQSQLGADSVGVDPGEVAVRLVAFEVQLPVAGTDGLRRNDRVTVTAAAHDADLVGREFALVGLAHKTHATSRRIQVQEVVV